VFWISEATQQKSRPTVEPSATSRGHYKKRF